MEEWKKVASQLDKDHAKGMTTAPTHTHTHGSHSRCALPFLVFIEYKKVRADIKKKSSDTIKLQKKVKKGRKNPSSDPFPCLWAATT